MYVSEKPAVSVFHTEIGNLYQVRQCHNPQVYNLNVKFLNV
jgi:hypothetical protein